MNDMNDDEPFKSNHSCLQDRMNKGKNEGHEPYEPSLHIFSFKGADADIKIIVWKNRLIQEKL